MTQESQGEGGEAIPGRRADDVTPEMIERALRELTEIVRARLPERFYRGEGHWPLLAAALIARIGGIGESTVALLHLRRQADTQVLVRSLYEHVLTYCWIAIDPRERVYAWRDHAAVQRKRLHNDAARLGIPVLTEEQLAEAAELDEIKQLIDRANEVDAYWSQHIRGFRPPAVAADPGSLLNFRGLYTGLYRTTSRSVHAQIETANDCIDFGDYPRRPATVHLEETDEVFWSLTACPLIAMALLVHAHRFRWPDAETVRDINDALLNAGRVA
jgi:Family of unknown function (DUF5677)